MKKLFYFFLAITVACSSGDDSSDNNDPDNDNSAERLIESITIISGNCENVYNLWLFYDNLNRVASVQSQYVETNCNGEQGTFGEVYEVEFMYTDNNVTVTFPSIGTSGSYPINVGGMLDDNEVTFVNNQLIYISPNSLFAGDCGVTYVWVENNLIEANYFMGDSENGIYCDGRQVNYEYYEDLNLIENFWIQQRYYWDTGLVLNGIAGRASKNLVSKITSISGPGNSNVIETINFQYQLDPDGYPTVIYINSSNDFSDIERTVTYEVTYMD
jgi:hypothetical protein